MSYPLASAVLPPTIGRPMLEMGQSTASRLGWAVIGAAGLGLVAAVCVGGLRLADILVVALLQFAALGACGTALRSRGWVRPSIGIAVESGAQLLLAALLAPLLSVVLARTNLPYRDEELLALDRALFGFDWGRMAAFAQTRPLLMEILGHVYASLSLQPIILFAMLIATGRAARAQAFCLAWILTLAATISVFPLVPAVGGYLHLGIAQADTHVLVPAAWNHIAVLGPARDGMISTLTGDTLDGIVTFPSFHAAAAVLLAWGFWGVQVLRWPALGINLAMMAATPVIGGHYLTDVVAGIALAGLALCVTDRLMRPASPSP